VQCPTNWLYDTSPELVLLGYQRRSQDVSPLWSALRASAKAFMRCWHSDRNALHLNNYLNVCFPTPDLSRLRSANYNILRCGEQALKLFECCGYLCVPCNHTLKQLDNEQLDGGVPHVASHSSQRCRVRDVLSRLLFNSTVGSLTTIEALA
jgi:hypothetical protein